MREEGAQVSSWEQSPKINRCQVLDVLALVDVCYKTQPKDVESGMVSG